MPLRPDQWYTVVPTETIPDETSRFGFRHRQYIGVDKGSHVRLLDEINEELIEEPEFQAYSLKRQADGTPAISFKTSMEAVSFKLRWG